MIGDGIHQQLGLDRLLGGLLAVGVELLPRAALFLQQLGEPGLIVVEAVDRVVQCGVDLGLDDGFRQRNLGELQQRLQRGVTDLLGLVDPLDAAHLLGQVVAQLGEGVELAGQLGELVVGRGQFAFLDRPHRHGDIGLVPGVLAGDQGGGEGRRLALGQADERVVKALDQLTGSDLVRQALGLGLGDVLAVGGRREIDRDEIAGLGRPVHTLEGAEAGPQRLQFGVDVGVGDLDGVDGDRQFAQIGQVDVGANVDLGGEHQLVAVLDLGDLDVGFTQRSQFGGGDRLAVAAGQHVVDHLLQHRATAEPGLQQLGRRLARPEAGEANLLSERLVGTVEVRLQLGEGHLHIDANPGGAQLLDGALHCAPCGRLSQGASG